MLSHVTREPVEIRLRLDPSLWPVRADQGQMEQVLVNLVSNAGDAMPRGGDIQVATSNRTIGPATPEAGDLPAGDYVALTVADGGVGMSGPRSVREHAVVNLPLCVCRIGNSSRRNWLLGARADSVRRRIAASDLYRIGCGGGAAG